ncbi:hypothetical protein ACHAXA_004581 [Cyclostephanos tholiformis]|uniref:Uncharacterized protein n=1 Tax=Cyclostephanos tholiformis TaxID=382380 RepID=A0ABD3RP79_9STRA
MRPSRNAESHSLVISRIDRHFRICAIGVLCTYAILVFTSYAIVPDEDILRLHGPERVGALAASLAIGASFVSHVVSIMGGFAMKWGTGPRAIDDSSGILVGALTVQIVALTTDVLMAFFPVPTAIDPVLGTRVLVLRWCEWCPCAAFMTFMMEGADLHWPGDEPPSDFLRTKYLHAVMQGGAVFLGLIFPFCPGHQSWMTCMAMSICLYGTNFPRLASRTRDVPSTLPEGATTEELERFNSARIALRLRYATTAVWSVIVVLFFASSVYGPRYAPEGSFLRHPSANALCECFFDVLSKVMFLAVIMEVHGAVFDPGARTERRLAELRKLMAAVWESSSDVIAISVRTRPNSDVTSTMLSPAFYGLGSGDGPSRNMPSEQVKDLYCRKSILYQLTVESLVEEENNNGPRVKPEMISHVEQTDFNAQGRGARVRDHHLIFDEDTVTPETGSLRAVSDVVARAWTTKGHEFAFTHDLVWTNHQIGKERVVHAEATVSRMDENALIVIVRDISERVRAFEAEKQIVFETTSRQKDAEANRFTRHEVKNGLLAAIGLYESLCDAQRSQLTRSLRGSIDLDYPDDDVVRCMNELGKSLHETLDTIQIEAMTRDLIHDLYRPKKEKINISSVLSGSANDHSHSFVGGMGNLIRFPLITRPSPLPMFIYDPNLLRYLHKEALSNACKYGKIGAVVLTEILYDEKLQKMYINVINLPGEFHGKLVAMGPDAVEMVFTKGCQLHESLRGDGTCSRAPRKKSQAAALPGNGAWILKKCANMMKGECTITFEESRTVFSLTIPAKPIRPQDKERISNLAIDVKTFSLPDRVWGIAIDDSKVQMKLLAKFFEFAGIQRDRIKVFGENAAEIMSFVDYVVNFMDENKGEYVLLIADENLDIMDEASTHVTISGSQLVENIRLRLLPEQEMKLVSLIRSANDSLSDVAIYNSRAHGFIPKAPIKKGNVLEALAPLWIARYPLETVIDDDSQSCFSRVDSETDSLDSSIASRNDLITSTPLEIMNTVNEINALISMGSMVENWMTIWEKLHVLKGDLLTLQVGSQVISAVGMINSFRTIHSNEDREERWTLLREHISNWLHNK